MIKKLRLRNFRGVKEGEIELSPLTILLGSNNSGKTAVLEALFLAPNPLRSTPYSNRSALDVVHSLHQTLDSSGFAFLLYNYTCQQASIESEVDGQSYWLGFVREGEVIRVKDKARHFGDVFTGSAREISVSSRQPVMGNSLLVSSTLIREAFKYLMANWVLVANSGVARRVMKDASKFSGEEYKDITLEPFLSGSLAAYAFLEDGRRIRLGDLGEGLQSYLMARILFEMERPEVLLWDDIECHLNPRMLLELAQWFSGLLEDGKQIVLTTHSLDAVRAIAGQSEERSGIYLTALEGSHLRLKKLSLKEVEELAEAGIDVRTADRFLL